MFARERRVLVRGGGGAYPNRCTKHSIALVIAIIIYLTRYYIWGTAATFANTVARSSTWYDRIINPITVPDQDRQKASCLSQCLDIENDKIVIYAEAVSVFLLLLVLLPSKERVKILS